MSVPLRLLGKSKITRPKRTVHMLHVCSLSLFPCQGTTSKNKNLYLEHLLSPLSADKGLNVVLKVSGVYFDVFCPKSIINPQLKILLIDLDVCSLSVYLLAKYIKRPKLLPTQHVFLLSPGKAQMLCVKSSV